MTTYTCPDCGARLTRDTTDAYFRYYCPRCAARFTRDDLNHPTPDAPPCDVCGGSGKRDGATCDECFGAGVSLR